MITGQAFPKEMYSSVKPWQTVSEVCKYNMPVDPQISMQPLITSL